MITETNGTAEQRDILEPLARWFNSLKSLANLKGCGFLVTKLEDHEQSFVDGYSPEQELSELLSICDDEGWRHC